MRTCLAILASVGMTSAYAQEVLDFDEVPREFREDIFDLTPWDPEYEPPRTEDGRPSFEGTWTNASITTLHRPEGIDKLVLTPEEAFAYMQKRTSTFREDEMPSDLDEGVLEAGDTSIEGAGGYNKFWIDIGSTLAVVDGEIRSSWLVRPESGQPQPKRTAYGSLLARRDAYQASENPEDRSVGDRCLAGFGGTGGPPMLNVLYNNTYEIAQTDDVLAVVVEMVHQPRVIRIGGTHRSNEMKPWLGDSIARWEGDTLVVHTTNHRPERYRRTDGLFIAEDSEVEERFTRVADDTIFYEFTVTDPEIYDVPHRGEMVFRKSDAPQYEYACHEGNYALPGILAGARREERLAAEDAAAN